MESIWRKETTIPSRDKLDKDIKVDIAIIGAGMAGLLTAYLLKRKGIDAVVLEGKEIASGQTQGTTAKITSQHSLIYDKLIKNFGKEKALLYAQANEKAIKMYQKIISEQDISCHFETLPAYVYTMDDITKIEKEVEAAKQLDIDAEFTTKTTLPFMVQGAVRFNEQAQFNPLEFIKHIAEPLTIYEHTYAKAIEDDTIITNNGKVKANIIVVTTHYPFINTPGYYFMRMHQARSYLLALKNASKLDGMYIDESKAGYTLRNYKDYLIFGGGGHRTGENYEGGVYKSLGEVAKRYFQGSEEICHWSAQDCMTIDNVPYIGLYSNSTPNLYVATGYKKWGMTGSMVSALIIRDMILGKKNSYEELYTPQRFQINASVLNLLKEGKHSTKGILLEKFSLPNTKLDEIEKGHGGIIDYEGEKIGVYKDDNGKAYMVTTKCTHLGCQLEWNPDELSWDCPCHGSRFDYTGAIIDNPAMENLEHE